MAYSNNNYSYFNPNTSSYSPKYDERSYGSKSSSNYTGYTGYSSSSLNSSGYVKESYNSDGSPHDVIKGQVTQLFTSFGYINDNIMFSKSCVSGPMVKMGDSVVVEVSFHPNNPVKYKGEKVIRCDDNKYTLSSGGRMNNFMNDRPIPRSDNYDSRKRHSPNKPSSLSMAKKLKTQSRSTTQLKGNSKFQSSAKSKLSDNSKSQKKTSIELKPGKNSVERSSNIRQSKSKSKDADKKESSVHSKQTGVPIKPTDSTNSLVAFTGDNLSIREFDAASLKYKYRGIQIPNQFFHLSLKYQQNFPLNHPLKLGNKCHFKVMDKRVICPDKSIEDQINKEVDPFDADSTFTAKVILMSMDELSDVYKQTVKFAEEFDNSASSKLPITKAMRFLVASTSSSVSKDTDINHEFAVGGRWSPSLDGENPDENPQVLINTAIRTTKSLTGIDLSNCTVWHKFLEFHYYRPMVTVEKKKNTKEDSGDITNDNNVEEVEYREPRMETVVYYLPDVWSIFPSSDVWLEEISKSYQNQLASILCPPPPPPTTVAPSSPDSNKTANDDSFNNSIDTSEEEDYDDIDSRPGEQTATHYSKLNVSSMKVAQLKKELELRKMNYRGVMVQLKARLKAALEKEENEEKNTNIKDDSKMVTEEVTTQELVSKLSDEEKETYKKIYTLPNSPHILIHPNKCVNNTQYKFRTTSLHTLLSYQDEKLEEPTFELAIFAKQLLQMIRRDAIFNIFKSVATMQTEDIVSKYESSNQSNKNVTTFKRTINRQLLLSYVIIDKDRTAKLPIDELKAMFASLGVCLSESQLDNILEKLTKAVDSNKMLNYRQLTDKEVSKEEEISKLINSDVVGEDLDYIKELAMGNKALFESELPVDIGNESEEVERLKNQLDKSERCRQELELKMSLIKEEAEKSVSEMLKIKKELDHYREASQDYRSRYHLEKDRKDQYKRMSDRGLSDLNTVKKRLNTVLSYVSYSIENQNKFNSKKNGDKESTKSTAKTNNLQNKKDSNNDDDKIQMDDIEDGGCDIIVLEEAEPMAQSAMNSKTVDNSESEDIEILDKEPSKCSENNDTIMSENETKAAEESNEIQEYQLVDELEKKDETNDEEDIPVPDDVLLCDGE